MLRIFSKLKVSRTYIETSESNNNKALRNAPLFLTEAAFMKMKWRFQSNAMNLHLSSSAWIRAIAFLVMRECIIEGYKALHFNLKSNESEAVSWRR